MFTDLFLTLREFGLKAIDSASRLIHRLSRGNQLRSNQLDLVEFLACRKLQMSEFRDRSVNKL